MNSLILSSSAGVTAQKVPETYRKKVIRLASGQRLEEQLFPEQKC